VSFPQGQWQLRIFRLLPKICREQWGSEHHNNGPRDDLIYGGSAEIGGLFTAYKKGTGSRSPSGAVYRNAVQLLAFVTPGRSQGRRLRTVL